MPARAKRERMTDNSRVRVSIVGVIAVALFGALFARLWFLQVGDGGAVEVQTAQRAQRVLQTESGRGQIFDAKGRPLVSNRVAWALTMDRERSRKQRAAVFGRLSELLGGRNTPESLERRFNDVRQSPLRPALIVIDTPEEARVRIAEHPDEYPGLEVRTLMLRSYPNGQTAPHVLGYVGEVNQDDLDAHDGYVTGDTIGRAGIEAAYEDELRGEPRLDTYEVDPTGRPVGEPVKTEDGTVGEDVQLTLDLDVQRVAEQSLASAIEQAKTRSYKTELGQFEFKAPGGAVVVLDAATSAVVASASFPTFSLAQFNGGITQDDWAVLTDEHGPKPLNNRAIQGLYAPGSTFKLVTAIAATRDGVISPDRWYVDKGSVLIGADKQPYENAGGDPKGPVNLSMAVSVSSDTYFYELGYEFWKRWNAGDANGGYGIQRAAREFGFGSKTNVEISEAAGRVPDAEWKRAFVKELYDNEADQQANEPWWPGDNVNLSVGQGDLVVTPLQLANAYAAFFNGGTLNTPHIADVVTNEKGKVVERVRPKPLGRLQFDPATYNALMAGFSGAVNDEDGTAHAAFAGFPLDIVPVAGKTGTAQVDGTGDTSLFVGSVEVGSKKYVIATVIEDAGFGSEVAAPVTRRVMEQLAGLSITPLVLPESEEEVGD
jgi:penicillin-binding protein 2